MPDAIDPYYKMWEGVNGAETPTFQEEMAFVDTCVEKGKLSPRGRVALVDLMRRIQTLDEAVRDYCLAFALHTPAWKTVILDAIEHRERVPYLVRRLRLPLREVADPLSVMWHTE